MGRQKVPRLRWFCEGCLKLHHPDTDKEGAGPGQYCGRTAAKLTRDEKEVLWAMSQDEFYALAHERERTGVQKSVAQMQLEKNAKRERRIHNAVSDLNQQRRLSESDILEAPNEILLASAGAG